MDCSQAFFVGVEQSYDLDRLAQHPSISPGERERRGNAPLTLRSSQTLPDLPCSVCENVFRQRSRSGLVEFAALQPFPHQRLRVAGQGLQRRRGGPFQPSFVRLACVVMSYVPGIGEAQESRGRRGTTSTCGQKRQTVCEKIAPVGTPHERQGLPGGRRRTVSAGQQSRCTKIAQSKPEVRRLIQPTQRAHR